jgi:monoamine oxidase
MSKSVINSDVIIVGSGLSGLTSAYRLVKNKIKVLILEATNEIGGRTRSFVTKTGESISYGGTWSTLEDNCTLGLANEINCLPFVPEISMELSALRNLILHPYMVIKLWLLGKEFSQNGTIDYDSELATKYDNISLDEWLKSESGYLNDEKSRKAVLDYLYFIESYSFEPTNISCFFAAIITYNRLHNITNTGFPLIPKNLRWEGGTGVFTHKLLQSILTEGYSDFMINQPAQEITQTNDGVLITTPDYIIHGKFVIVATSPCAALNIRYSPDLPEKTHKLCKSICPWNDPALNIVLIFKKHFLNGIVPLIDFVFPTKEVIGPIFDLTPKDSSKGFYRILCNPDFIKDMSQEQLKNSALKLLTFYYPHEELNIHDLYEDMIILNWTKEQPWIPAVTYYYPPGILSKYGSTLREPFGNIYWGGSERSIKGLHWIEGAINRGNDVAGEILLKLEKISTLEQYNQELNKLKETGVNTIRHTGSLSNFHNLLTSIKSAFSALLFHHEFPHEKYRTANLTEKEYSILQQKLS